MLASSRTHRTMRDVCATRDQTVELACIDIGRMNLAGFPGGGMAGGGLGIVAWKSSQLSSLVNSTTTQFPVVSSAPFTGVTRIRVDNEICHITSINGNTLNVDRGQEGTSAASHDPATSSPVVALGKGENHPRILLSNEGKGVGFSDGTNAVDASISRPAAGQINIESDALVAKSGGKVGFYGTTPILKPTVSGSRGGNAALTSLLSALSQLGLIVNNTST